MRLAILSIVVANTAAMVLPVGSGRPECPRLPDPRQSPTCETATLALG